jgi:hypothetical protein
MKNMNFLHCIISSDFSLKIVTLYNAGNAGNIYVPWYELESGGASLSE